MKNITNTEKIANELLIEKYEPIMVLKLNIEHISTMSDIELKDKVKGVSEHTGYKVLLLPTSGDSDAKIIGVCGTQQFDMHELQGIILDSFDDVDIMMGSFDKVEKFIKNRYNG
tara:strand:+ start:110 stop:451 length:342 start_codon:yes stop_codon:yes gene_type:complete